LLRKTLTVPLLICGEGQFFVVMVLERCYDSRQLCGADDDVEALGLSGTQSASLQDGGTVDTAQWSTDRRDSSQSLTLDLDQLDVTRRLATTHELEARTTHRDVNEKLPKHSPLF